MKKSNGIDTSSLFRIPDNRIPNEQNDDSLTPTNASEITKSSSPQNEPEQEEDKGKTTMRDVNAFKPSSPKSGSSLSGNSKTFASDRSGKQGRRPTSPPLSVVTPPSLEPASLSPLEPPGGLKPGDECWCGQKGSNDTFGDPTQTLGAFYSMTLMGVNDQNIVYWTEIGEDKGEDYIESWMFCGGTPVKVTGLKDREGAFIKIL